MPEDEVDDYVQTHTNIDVLVVKAESERVILNLGGEILDWLPYVGEGPLRSREEIVSRSLILNAMVNIAFKAPIHIIRGWISANSLEGYISPKEQVLLAKSNDQLTEQELSDISWSMEALWALMWVGTLIKDLPLGQPLGSNMASLTPNLQRSENGSKFADRMRLRSYKEAYGMRDLYFRANWYTRNCGLTRKQPVGMNGDIVMERCKALRWAMDLEADWDDCGG